MVKLNGTQLSEADSLESNKILYAIGDFERLGDHGVNIMYSIRKAYEANLEFTDDAKEEIAVLVDAVKEIVYLATQAYIGNNIETAICVEPLEQVIDNIVFSMKSRHMVRLKEGKCSIDMGFILQDIHGTGTAFLEIDGNKVEKELAPGEVLKVDTGNVVAFEKTVNYEIETVKGLKNIFFGGEGLFLTKLTGPGRVILQTQNFNEFAGRIISMIPSK